MEDGRAWSLPPVVLGHLDRHLSKHGELDPFLTPPLKSTPPSSRACKRTPGASSRHEGQEGGDRQTGDTKLGASVHHRHRHETERQAPGRGRSQHVRRKGLVGKWERGLNKRFAKCFCSSSGKCKLRRDRLVTPRAGAAVEQWGHPHGSVGTHRGKTSLQKRFGRGYCSGTTPGPEPRYHPGTPRCPTHVHAQGTRAAGGCKLPNVCPPRCGHAESPRAHTVEIQAHGCMHAVRSVHTTVRHGEVWTRLGGGRGARGGAWDLCYSLS